MQVAQGALRQGAMYDMLDREPPETDLRTLDGARPGAELCRGSRPGPPGGGGGGATVCTGLARSRGHRARKLGWAAQLHEIGCRISHSDYHRHGAYILDNTDVVGFAQHELHRLGASGAGATGAKCARSRPTWRHLVCRATAVSAAGRDSVSRTARPRSARTDPGLDGSRFSLRARTGWAASYPNRRTCCAKK